jgi:flagellar biosynthesis/type III secretory pathway chaperone
MIAATERSEIESLLARLEQASSDLAHAISDERAALGDLDVNTLDSTRGRKQQALADLEDCECTRRRLCAGARVAPDAAGMRALLQSFDGAGALAERWAHITTSLDASRRANRAAGALLRASRRRVSDVIALLRGGGRSRELYGPDGRAHQPDGGVPIARA